MIKKFHERLQEIVDDVNKMGKLIQVAVEDSTDSLIKGDRELATKVVDGDNIIDNLR